jgi:SAM-dependent methyltransferase
MLDLRDLIWSEGALYNLGLETALSVCHGLLRPGGYLAFTDAVWRKDIPPAAVKAGFDLDDPTMGRVEDVIATIRKTEFETIGRFTLPDEAWWTDFYTPMQKRIEDLRRRHHQDPDAITILDQIAAEPEIHRRYSDYYAYEFFVLRRPLV